jgi:hypothetical protein
MRRGDHEVARRKAKLGRRKAKSNGFGHLEKDPKLRCFDCQSGPSASVSLVKPEASG